MIPFTPEELAVVHSLWKSVDQDHVWTGWASAGEKPTEIWIFRTRARWRRFPLVKDQKGFMLRDERNRVVATAATLEGLLKEVEAIPGLNDPTPS